jgi:hypothetical protein
MKKTVCIAFVTVMFLVSSLHAQESKPENVPPPDSLLKTWVSFVAGAATPRPLELSIGLNINFGSERWIYRVGFNTAQSLWGGYQNNILYGAAGQRIVNLRFLQVNVFGGISINNGFRRAVVRNDIFGKLLYISPGANFDGEVILKLLPEIGIGLAGNANFNMDQSFYTLQLMVLLGNGK